MCFKTISNLKVANCLISFTSGIMEISIKCCCGCCVSTLERFPNDSRKTKTKAITPTNHNRSRQRFEAITIPSNYL